MKKRMGIFLTLLFCFLSVMNVWADDGGGQKPDYVTDYYMIVECAEGGVNIYDEASLEADKLNDELIPNGAALHIIGEKSGEDSSHWGYVQHRNMYGYVPFDHLKPVTASEAAESEYRTYNGYDVEFDVKIKSPEGQAPVYTGPGDQFGKNTQGLDDGTTAHITQYVEPAEGRAWGKTSTEGVEGWVDLIKNSDYAENEAVESVVTEAGIAAGVIKAPEPTATPTPKPTATPVPTATPTPKPTATTAPTATPEPTKEATATPTEEAEATPTKEAAATPTEEAEVTPTEAAEVAPTEEAKETPAEEAEVTPTEEAKETAGENVKEQKKGSYLIWIIVILVLAIAALVVYFMKRKNKDQ